MPTTPVYLFPYPLATDPADGPKGFSDLALRVEAVLQQQVNALDSRLDVLEAAGPMALQYGSTLLGSQLSMSAGSWLNVLSTPSLGSGKWVVFAQAQFNPTDNTMPNPIVARLSGSVSGIKSSAEAGLEGTYGSSPVGRPELVLHGVFAVATSEVVTVQAYSSTGRYWVNSHADLQASGANATQMVWIRVAP